MTVKRERGVKVEGVDDDACAALEAKADVALLGDADVTVGDDSDDDVDDTQTQQQVVRVAPHVYRQLCRVQRARAALEARLAEHDERVYDAESRYLRRCVQLGGSLYDDLGDERDAYVHAGMRVVMPAATSNNSSSSGSSNSGAGTSNAAASVASNDGGGSDVSRAGAGRSSCTPLVTAVYEGSAATFAARAHSFSPCERVFTAGVVGALARVEQRKALRGFVHRRAARCGDDGDGKRAHEAPASPAVKLSRQLQRLQVRTSDDKRLNSSFLFSKTDAAHYSREQIRQLALHGLQSLVTLDNRLHLLIARLFDAAHVRKERATLSAADQAARDDDVELCLALLSPHLFLTAAQQVFEFLVRVHEVHVYNVAAVLRAFLPYHDHNLFVRALLLLDVRDTGLDFLATNQERGAPLLREQLVLACAESRKVLQLVCQTAATAARLRVRHPAALALFASVACALATAPRRGVEAESAWRVLLPLVVEFLGSSSSNDDGVCVADPHTKAMTTMRDDGAEGDEADDDDAASVAFAARTRCGDMTGQHDGSSSAGDREVVCTALVVLVSWTSAVRFTLPMLTTLLKPVLQLAQHAAAADVVAAAATTTARNAEATTSTAVALADVLAVVDVVFESHARVVRQVAFAPLLHTLLALPWDELMQQQPQQQYSHTTSLATRMAEAASGSSVAYASLLRVLTTHCVARLRVAQSVASVPGDVLRFVHCAATRLPLARDVVEQLVRALLLLLVRPRSTVDGDTRDDNINDNNDNDNNVTMAVARRGDDRDDGYAVAVLHALQRRHVHHFDAILARALRSSNNDNDDDDDDNGGEAAAAMATAASLFLSRHLRGSRYTMIDLAAAHVQQQQQRQQEERPQPHATSTTTTTAASATPAQLPLFACMLHPTATIRVLAVDALRAMPLAQLCSATRNNNNDSDNDNNNNSDNTLIDLLAHVLSYEADVRVAAAMTHTAGAVLAQLVDVLVTPSPASSSQQRNGDDDDEQHDGAVAAAVTRALSAADAVWWLRRLLHALQALRVLHRSHATVLRVYAREVCSPLLSRLCAAVAAPQQQHDEVRGSTKPRRRASRARASRNAGEATAHNDDGNTTVSPHVTSAYGTVLYYTLLLYAAVHDDNDDDGDGDAAALRDEVATLLCAAVPAWRTHSETNATTTTTPTAAHVRSNDEQEDDDDYKHDATATATTTATRHADDAATVALQTVMQHASQLHAAVAEAQSRLPLVLTAAQRTLLDSDTTPRRAAITQEVCIASALCLSSSSLSSCRDATQRRLLRFLLGTRTTHDAATNNNDNDDSSKGNDDSGDDSDALQHGYLYALQAHERAQLSEAAAIAKAVGRGAHNSRVLSPYLPHDALTRSLACVVQHSVTHAQPSSSSSSSTSLSLQQTTTLLCLLACLDAPLPPLLSALSLPMPALPAALFRLLGSDDDDDDGGSSSSAVRTAARLFGIDWYALVYAAVYTTHNNTSTSNNDSSCDTEAATLLPCVALTMLLPLCASTPERRDGALRVLQDVIVRSGSRSSNDNSSAATLLMTLLSSAHAPCNTTSSSTTLTRVSVTTLSALVEVMAGDNNDDSNNKRHTTLPSAAAELLCDMLTATTATSAQGNDDVAYVVPDALASRVVCTYFTLATTAASSPSSSSSSSSRQRRSLPRLSLARLLPRIESILTRAHQHNNNNNAAATTTTTTTTAAAASLVQSVAARSVIGDAATPHDDAAVRLCLLLLRHSHLRLARGRSGSAGDNNDEHVVVRPVYTYALTMLSTALQQGTQTHDDEDGGDDSVPRIFRRATYKRSSGSSADTNTTASNDVTATCVLSEAYVRALATLVRATLVQNTLRLGTDVATLCTRTRGGYHRLFVPYTDDLLARAARQQQQREQHAHSNGNDDAGARVRDDEWQTLAELVESVVPTAATPHHHQDGNSSSRHNNDVTAAQTSWQPPTSCVLPYALTCSHARRLVDLCMHTLVTTTTTTTPSHTKHNNDDDSSSSSGVTTWPRCMRSVYALRVLTALLQAAPAMRYRERTQHDDDKHNDDNDKSGESLLQFVLYVLQRFSLDKLLPLLVAHTDSLRVIVGSSSSSSKATTAMAESAGAMPDVLVGDVYARSAYALLRALVQLVVAQTSRLCEHDAHGATRVRTALVKQTLSLMSGMLTHVADDDNDNDNTRRDATTAEQRNARDTDVQSLHVTETVGQLLRGLSPLLCNSKNNNHNNSNNNNSKTRTSKQATTATARDDTDDVNAFLLHIPLLALLLRLEAVEHTQALQFRAAVDVCREVLLSFDVDTQLICLSQMMRLLADPHAQLSHKTSRSNTTAAADNNNNNSSDDDDVVHTLRRFVKPNQLINRQETVLQLINSTVKTDAFLSRFIAQQHRSRRSSGNNTVTRDDDGDSNDDDDDAVALAGDHATTTTARSRRAVTRTRGDACTHLLVATLELYTHYATLNAQTPNERARPAHVDNNNNDDTSTDEVYYSEDKAYVMLLELLSGNTLACVLAGISETTLVQCLQQLLGHRRAALQRKGLEVLLDRLHHSLPTHEHTLDAATATAQRVALRDPKSRVTLADLVRIKARPRTTKRSFALVPVVCDLLRHALDDATTTTTTTTTASSSSASVLEHCQRVQLCVACVEELVRIVACGGSLQAEQTLMNVQRARKLTDALLSRLFGNKARVQLVHAFVRDVCEKWLPALTRHVQQLQQQQPPHQQQHDGQAARAVANAHGISSISNSDNDNTTTLAALLSVMSGMLTSLGSIVHVMGVGFATTHTTALLRSVVDAAVFGVTQLPRHGMATRAAGTLLRRATLVCLQRLLALCWSMTQPYIAPIVFAVTHHVNVGSDDNDDDGDDDKNDDDDDGSSSGTRALCDDVLSMLEALLPPHVLLDAMVQCLHGVPYVMFRNSDNNNNNNNNDNDNNNEQQQQQQHDRRVVLRVRVATHSLRTLYACVQRRVQSLRKDELLLMPLLVGGATVHDNFWLASLHLLAGASTTPSSVAVTAVVDAYAAFFVKFRAKRCTALLYTLAQWAFALDGDTSSRHHRRNDDDATHEQQGSETTTRPLTRRQRRRRDDYGDESNSSSNSSDNDDDNSNGGDDTRALSRLRLHAWLFFFTLYNRLLERLGSIADFSFVVVLPHIVDTLTRFSASHHVTTTTTTTATASPRARRQAHAQLIVLCLQAALEAVRRMSLAQTPPPDHDYSVPFDVYFAADDVFNRVMPAVVHQLHNTTTHVHDDGVYDYAYVAEHHVLPAIRAFFACLPSNKLQSKTQAELLRGLRHRDARVRRATLRVLDVLYGDGGEELASRLMAEMLPAVVEVTEDDDDDVVEEARRLCTNLSRITGQDVLHAMS